MSQDLRRLLPRLLPIASAAVLAMTLIGCAAPASHTKKDSAVAGIPRQTRVLLMEPDVQISEITAGGMLEPKADWTEAGQANIRAALQELLKNTDDTLIPYKRPEDPAEARADDQLLKLHEMVSATIIDHNYQPHFKLPTKEGELDYTLGERAKRLRDRTGADYALFLFVRDSHVSPGRMAMMVSAALLGAVVPGGVQQGFTSLVDLRSGDIVWCNLHMRHHGDLRKPDLARESVAALLSGLPL